MMGGEEEEEEDRLGGEGRLGGEDCKGRGEYWKGREE